MKSNIVRFISNDFLVGLANSIFNLAVMWFVLDQTGSAFYTATIGSLSHVAQILMGSYAGIKADQFNHPVKMMVYSLRVNSVILLVICISIGLFDINMIFLIFLLMCREIAIVFQFPNQNKLIPQLVRTQAEVKKVISYRSLTKNVSMMFGFAGAGFLFTLLPFPMLIIAILSLYIIGSLLISHIHIAHQNNQHIQSKKHQNSYLEFKKTLAMIMNDYYLKRVLMSAAVLNIISMVAPTFVVYFNQYLNSNAQDYGLFQFLIALGSMVAATIGIKLKKHIPSYTILLLFWTLMAITFIYMYFNTSTSIAVILGVIIGLCLTLPNILFSTYKIIMIEDAYRGRITGVIQSISTLFIPISYFFSAYIAESYGANVVYLIAGICQLIIVIWLLCDYKMKANFNALV